MPNLSQCHYSRAYLRRGRRDFTRDLQKRPHPRATIAKTREDSWPPYPFTAARSGRKSSGLTISQMPTSYALYPRSTWAACSRLPDRLCGLCCRRGRRYRVTPPRERSLSECWGGPDATHPAGRSFALWVVRCRRGKHVPQCKCPITSGALKVHDLDVQRSSVLYYHVRFCLPGEKLRLPSLPRNSIHECVRRSPFPTSCLGRWIADSVVHIRAHTPHRSRAQITES